MTAGSRPPFEESKALTQTTPCFHSLSSTLYMFNEPKKNSETIYQTYNQHIPIKIHFLIKTTSWAYQNMIQICIKEEQTIHFCRSYIISKAKRKKQTVKNLCHTITIWAFSFDSRSATTRTHERKEKLRRLSLSQNRRQYYWRATVKGKI